MENLTQFLDAYAPMIIGPWNRWILIGGQALALICFIYELITMKRNFQFIGTAIFILGLGWGLGEPYFFISFAYAFLAYTLLYPLQMTRKAKLFTYLFKPLALVLMIIYLAALFYCRHYEGFEWYWRLALLIVWLLASYALVAFWNQAEAESICPHCGRCADNEKGDLRWEDDGCQYLYFTCSECGKTYRIKEGEKKK